MNQVTLSGVITDIRFSRKGGKPAAKVTIDGFTVAFNGRTAEIINGYVAPGSTMAIVGELKKTGRSIKITGQQFNILRGLTRNV